MTALTIPDASIAAVLNQTAIIFQSVVAVLILKERFARRQLAALTLALTGVVVTTFGAAISSFFVK